MFKNIIFKILGIDKEVAKKNKKQAREELLEEGSYPLCEIEDQENIKIIGTYGYKKPYEA